MLWSAGADWTIVSAGLLFIPTTLVAILLTRPTRPYWMMAVAAATAGLGGGNFASSMANISYFYPDCEKGYALGLNAAGGNIGVSTVQFLIPIVLGLPIFNLYMAAPQAPETHLPAERGAVLVSAYRDRRLWGCALHEQPDVGTLELQRPARHRAPEAYLGDGRALHKHLRVVHRIFGPITGCGTGIGAGRSTRVGRSARARP